MGKDQDQTYETTMYNLDVIISVGYRVKSVQGTRFRQWATSVLKQYLIKGYVINQQIKIDRYNELCDQGTDADFGKKSAYMHKIEKAPFWGIRKHIRVSSIDSGVNTNANGQALDADGNVIDGLYCVGNVGGVFYGGADYPFHQTGLSLGRCYTFGMLAAKHAMGQL